MTVIPVAPQHPCPPARRPLAGLEALLFLLEALPLFAVCTRAVCSPSLVLPALMLGDLGISIQVEDHSQGVLRRAQVL